MQKDNREYILVRKRFRETIKNTLQLQRVQQQNRKLKAENKMLPNIPADRQEIGEEVDGVQQAKRDIRRERYIVKIF